MLFPKHKEELYASICLDGWENPTGLHIYALSVRINNQNYLFKQYSTIESQNSEWVKQIINDSLQFMKERNIIIKTITTDNAPVLVKACGEIEGIVHHRCVCHCINLLIKKYTYKFNILEFCKECISKLEKSKQKYKIKYYTVTRWYSMYEFIGSIQIEYKRLFIEEEEKKTIDKLEVFLYYFKIFNETIAKLEEERCTIFDEFIHLINLRNKLETPEYKQEHANYILKKYDKMYFTKIDISNLVCLAGFLNPNTLNEAINNYHKRDLMKKVHEGISMLGCTLDSKILNSYYNKEVPYIFTGNNPYDDWNDLYAQCKEESLKKKLENVLTVIKILLSVSQSETYVERVFSGENLIHTPLRSKLNPSTAENLTFLYMNHKIWQRLRTIK